MNANGTRGRGNYWMHVGKLSGAVVQYKFVDGSNAPHAQALKSSLFAMLASLAAIVLGQLSRHAGLETLQLYFAKSPFRTAPVACK